jgi:hypothetical protein
MKSNARALAATAFSSALAMAIAGVYACGSDESAGTPLAGGGDAASDVTSGGYDGGGGPVGDGSATAANCANFADAATLNESLGTGTLKGTDVDGTFCARVKIRKPSYQHQSPSDLVLEIGGIPNSYAFNIPSSVGGELIVYVGLNTDTPGVSASTDPNQCGTVFASALRTPTAEANAHCLEDAGDGHCPRGCSSVNHEPCKPVPERQGYEAALAGACVGEIKQPQGSWKVTITSMEPKSFGPPYIVHGTLEGTLLERGDGGPAGTPATITITF